MLHDPKIDERAEIARQLAEWTAAGGLPELVTTCRAEKTMATMAEANAATWRDRK